LSERGKNAKIHLGWEFIRGIPDKIGAVIDALANGEGERRDNRKTKNLEGEKRCVV
jgi:hypothetical protein